MYYIGFPEKKESYKPLSLLMVKEPSVTPEEGQRVNDINPATHKSFSICTFLFGSMIINLFFCAHTHTYAAGPSCRMIFMAQSIVFLYL